MDLLNTQTPNEVIQFAQAEAVGNKRWILSGLLRGRGGTEAASLSGHEEGAPFILLDDQLIILDEGVIGQSPQTQIAALGLADDAPVLTPILNSGLARQPLTPVHPSAALNGVGDLSMNWVRRARGAWNWPEGLEIPLHEEAEVYRVGLGSPDNPEVIWQINQTSLTISAAQLATLSAAHSGEPLWVSQTGSFGNSDPLLLHTLA